MTESQSYGQIIEVTEENFETEFPTIKKVISECSFVSFDMEFTGLEVKSCHKGVVCDTVLFDVLSYS